MLTRRIRALVLAVAALGLLTVPANRSAARTGMSGGLGCEYAGQVGGQGRLWCTAYISGGVPPYTYNWTVPPVYAYDNEALVRCDWYGGYWNYLYGGYLYQITATVTDSYGATRNLTTSHPCRFEYGI